MRFIFMPSFQTSVQFKKYLEENNFEIKSFKFERIPNDLKILTEEEQKDVDKLLEKMDEDEDVVNVFHNMKQD